MSVHTERFHQWLVKRAEWLRSEYIKGGDFQHLHARELEAQYIAEMFDAFQNDALSDDLESKETSNG